MIDNIISLISVIRDRANKFIVDGMEKRGICGLVPSHGTILYSLFATERLTMKELADRTGKDKSTVTALVDKLLAMGTISKDRDPLDQRVYYISLTEKGAAMKDDFFQLSEELMSTIYSGLSESDEQALLVLLNKIKDNF